MITVNCHRYWDTCHCVDRVCGFITGLSLAFHFIVNRKYWFQTDLLERGHLGGFSIIIKHFKQHLTELIWLINLEQ